MNQTVIRWMSCGLICLFLLGTSSDAWARYNSGAFRRYMQQQQKQQQQMMQMQQKVMMEAMARQAAIDKAKRDNLAKASKARHDKEEQHRQEMIAKRKAEQANKTVEASSTNKK